MTEKASFFAHFVSVFNRYFYPQRFI